MRQRSTPSPPNTTAAPSTSGAKTATSSAASALRNSRNGVLRLSTHRFGQTKPQTLELTPDKDRRTPHHSRGHPRPLPPPPRAHPPPQLPRLEARSLPHRDGPREILRPRLRPRLTHPGPAGLGRHRHQRRRDASHHRRHPHPRHPLARTTAANPAPAAASIRASS